MSNSDKKILDENGYTITRVKLDWPVDKNSVDGIIRYPDEGYTTRIFAPKVDVTKRPNDSGRPDSDILVPNSVKGLLTPNCHLREAEYYLCLQYGFDSEVARYFIAKYIHKHGQQDRHGDWFYSYTILSHIDTLKARVDRLEEELCDTKGDLDNMHNLAMQNNIYFE